MLSDNLKQQIRKYCQSVFQGTEGFNLHQFFNDLPPELSFAMKHELCLPVLKEVIICSIVSLMVIWHFNLTCRRFNLGKYLGRSRRSNQLKKNTLKKS